MEEILSIAVFGLGAAMGMKTMRRVGGLSPFLRAALVGGIVAANAARTAASRARTAVEETSTSAQRGLKEIRAEAEAEVSGSRRPPVRTPSGPRRIRVVKDGEDS